jgi:hypothetical protein
VSSILPENAAPLFLTEQSEISSGVDSDAILAGYLSEGDSGDLGASYKVFDRCVWVLVSTGARE